MYLIKTGSNSVEPPIRPLNLEPMSLPVRFWLHWSYLYLLFHYLNYTFKQQLFFYNKDCCWCH